MTRGGTKTASSPTRSAVPRELGPTLERNITVLEERRRQEEGRASWSDRLAAAVTRFAGSMTFVWIHGVVFGFWALANLGWVPGVGPWDPTFVILATIASVEAIFLSTFVLISQNRMAAAADMRADLNLQVSLLTEHEITRMADVLARLAERLEVSGAGADLQEVRRDVAPEAVLDRLATADDEGNRGSVP